MIFSRPLTGNIQKRESNVTTTTIVTEIPTSYATYRGSNGALQMLSNPRAVSPLMVSRQRHYMREFLSTVSFITIIKLIVDLNWNLTLAIKSLCLFYPSNYRKDSTKTLYRIGNTGTGPNEMKLPSVRSATLFKVIFTFNFVLLKFFISNLSNKVHY